MKYRILGKTGYKVSEIGYGAWSLGADWGDVTEEQAVQTLQSVVDTGINFIDTADVYGDGRSEKLIGQFKSSVKKPLYVATKAGRRLKPHAAAGYTKRNLYAYIERSLQNLQTDHLDLIQLHCPPNQVYYTPEVFEALDEMKEHNIISHYGVSVEKVEEGLKALEYPNLSTIQIIFNMFRPRPMELFFKEALKKNVGIIVRVPLASGLLTGRMTKSTEFPQNDHREYNRNGEAFDVGETFAGVDFETGLKAVEKLKKIKPEGYTMAQFALKWILNQEAVSTVIAGGKSPEQVTENSQTSDLPDLDIEIMKKVEKIYSSSIRELVHDRW